jgi:RsiW-degrading membrane proteinase PrsW (M82 family)
MNVRAKQALMLVGWLIILVLTIHASIADFSGVFTIMNEPWSALVTTDLTIELILICVWIYWDCGRRGKMPWIWIVAALVLGALSTLGYLLVRSMDKDAPPVFGSK